MLKIPKHNAHYYCSLGKHAMRLLDYSGNSFNFLLNSASEEYSENKVNVFNRSFTSLYIAED